MNEQLINDILRTEKTANSKKARRPSEGIYYVIPRKIGSPIVVSRRADEHEDPEKLLHIFFWDNVLRSIAHEYDLSQKEIEQLKNSYMAIPRGRVRKEYDIKTNKYTGEYVIEHGNEIPIDLISNYVYQDFGLYPLVSAKKIIWQINEHIKSSKEDQNLLNKIINRKK